MCLELCAATWGQWSRLRRLFFFWSSLKINACFSFDLSCAQYELRHLLLATEWGIEGVQSMCLLWGRHYGVCHVNEVGGRPEDTGMEQRWHRVCPVTGVKANRICKDKTGTLCYQCYESPGGVLGWHRTIEGPKGLRNVFSNHIYILSSQQFEDVYFLCFPHKLHCQLEGRLREQIHSDLEFSWLIHIVCMT